MNKIPYEQTVSLAVISDLSHKAGRDAREAIRTTLSLVESDHEKLVILMSACTYIAAEAANIFYSFSGKTKREVENAICETLRGGLYRSTAEGELK